MPHFIAIKIHFDHRNDLPCYLKYSRPATAAEHAEYLARFKEEKKGGNGFHECLNFSIPESGPVRIYLPSTCRPGIDRLNDEFVIFSFTYKKDPDMQPQSLGFTVEHASSVKKAYREKMLRISLESAR